MFAVQATLVLALFAWPRPPAVGALLFLAAEVGFAFLDGGSQRGRRSNRPVPAARHAHLRQRRPFNWQEIGSVEAHGDEAVVSGEFGRVRLSGQGADLLAQAIARQAGTLVTVEGEPGVVSSGNLEIWLGVGPGESMAVVPGGQPGAGFAGLVMLAVPLVVILGLRAPAEGTIPALVVWAIFAAAIACVTWETAPGFGVYASAEGVRIARWRGGPVAYAWGDVLGTEAAEGGLWLDTSDGRRWWLPQGDAVAHFAQVVERVLDARRQGRLVASPAEAPPTALSLGAPEAGDRALSPTESAGGGDAPAR